MLTIAEIFSNLSFYRNHYLAIIRDPQRYQTAVADAYIQVWPLGRQALYLGDLLQLWFSDKWIIHAPCQLLLDSHPKLHKQFLQREHDLYLYQLKGNLLSNHNTSQAWSLSEQKTLAISLDSVLKYLCIYKGTAGSDQTFGCVTVLHSAA